MSEGFASDEETFALREYLFQRSGITMPFFPLDLSRLATSYEVLSSFEVKMFKEKLNGVE